MSHRGRAGSRRGAVARVESRVAKAIVLAALVVEDLRALHLVQMSRRYSTVPHFLSARVFYLLALGEKTRDGWSQRVRGMLRGVQPSGLTQGESR